MSGLPVPATTQPFDHGHIIRPPLHRRAFYEVGEQGDALAIKGTEVLADDLAEAVERAARYRITSSGLNLLDHFANRENKVPLAVLTKESLEEARKAATFQTAYARRYGTLARAPLPLMVYAWPSHVAERHAEVLSRFTNPRTQSIVEELLAGGVSTLVYHYPTLPVRVRDLTTGLHEHNTISGFAPRMAALRKQIDPEVAIDGWTRMMVRSWSLGLFLCRSTNIHAGQALQPQNAVIDGGLVDVDSMVPFDEIRDEASFIENVLVSFLWLGFTVRELYLGLGSYTRPFRHPILDRVGDGVISSWVAGAVRRRMERVMEEEERLGHAFDPRIIRAVRGAAGDGLGLEHVFGALYPGTDRVHRGPWT